MSKESRQTVVLDVKGLNCPMPLLKAKKALNELEARGVAAGIGN